MFNEKPMDMVPPGKCSGMNRLPPHSVTKGKSGITTPVGGASATLRTRLLFGTVGVPSLSASIVQVVLPVMLGLRVKEGKAAKPPFGAT
jgi:hypothetical protein